MLVRFVHISDTHIGQTPDLVSAGHAPFANLEHCVDAINALEFPVDFVLHAGDVVEDGSEGAYRRARLALSRLRVPVYYAAGNHDDAAALQRVLLERSPVSERFDYHVTVDGVFMVVLDSRGPHDPCGTLTDGQLSELRAVCRSAAGPLLIVIHHPPLPLDCPWLDDGWPRPDGPGPRMLLDRGAEFLDAIAPARDRIRGVFFGHVHRAFEVVQNGILFSSAPSAFAQFLTWPGQTAPRPSPAEPAGFNLVTVTADRTVVRQHFLARPVTFMNRGETRSPVGGRASADESS